MKKKEVAINMYKSYFFLFKDMKNQKILNALFGVLEKALDNN
jgi:hypothetical protein